MENFVILDIGSNSVRMAINQIESDGSYREVKRVKNDSRLSEGMGREKLLRPAAIKRTIGALQNFQNVYKEYPNVHVKVIATAAVRQANNQSTFLKKVRDVLGLRIKILSGNQEAYYDYLGVVNNIKEPNYILVDIGGASMELVLVQNHKKKNLISLPMGAVSLSEHYHLGSRINAADLFNAECYIQQELHRVFWLKWAYRYPLVLLGGATRALARINQHHQHLNRSHRLNRYQLKQTQVLKTFEILVARDNAQRKQISGLESDRADIIVGGLLPLVSIINRINSKQVIFADSGVREGLINEYLRHMQANQKR
ncbi:Ppx/GppA family phosphatase [Lactobacillus sp. Sy-1]|uniref:Ppx/GppA family phosphatase n=1 Tax=Lactobacillus sp. Sy-1 TaxID=2109645 RepID=UPI001C577DD4|nr:Ppx/GppA family phosphatase [Lactobacillus sp. Sy-1]MBW1604814.1 Ppx/GppA family phosphatase [Lactobacillus sp. Sy-1]